MAAHQQTDRSAQAERRKQFGWQATASGPGTYVNEEEPMHEIKVTTLSPEEEYAGVAELWAGGRLLAYTLLDDGDLMLRIDPRHDGAPVVVGVHSLARALAEVDRSLAL